MSLNTQELVTLRQACRDLEDAISLTEELKGTLPQTLAAAMSISEDYAATVEVAEGLTDKSATLDRVALALRELVEKYGA
jgi:hypothetical protein